MSMPRISCRPKLSFTQEELDFLTKLSRSRNQAASIVTRSKIVLLSYQGKNDTDFVKFQFCRIIKYTNILTY